VEAASNALLELGRVLQRAGYEFVTVTPETHRRVNARADARGHGQATGLRDVFGWNRPFGPELLSRELLELLRTADALEARGEVFRSRVRFSTLRGRLFAHSAYPTLENDAVFFGPDTYRFCELLDRWAPTAQRVADIGCGSGAGAISIANRTRGRVLADVSSRALYFSRVNAALNEVNAVLVQSDVLDSVPAADLVIANPPYLRDPAGRLYREGGGQYGESLALRIVAEALERLSKGGTLVLYTGAAVVRGRDVFRREVAPLLRSRALDVIYQELDPDVFGEELDRPEYAEVERIAAVGLRVIVR
jgi:release factor glutamine methyltransferase